MYLHKETAWAHVFMVKRHLSYVIDAIIKCYQGDCTLCKCHSYVCKGNSTKFLLPNKSQICFSCPDDEKLIRDCLNYRLGRKGVEMTSLNSNTHKVESINRTYQKTNPKTVTWSRNFPARIHSAVHLRNNKLSKSVTDKMQSVGISPSRRVVSHLKKEEQYMKKD